MSRIDPPRPPESESGRRRLSRLGIGLAAVVLATGWGSFCSCGPQSPAASAIQASTPPPPAEPAKLVLLAMADYIDPAILRDFEKETGAVIEHETYEEPDEIAPRLRSRPGTADIVVVDSFSIRTLGDARLISPLRHEALPNRKNISPRFRGLSCDPKGEFSIPYHWGTTLIAYRRDLLPDPGHSWSLLWDPRLRGRVMMLSDSFEPMAVAMILKGIDPSMPNEDGYRTASEMLINHLETQGARYGSDDEVKDALVAGTVTAAMCYSGDAAVAASENPQVDFFIPSEGAMVWVDCMAICRDSSNPELAHRFLNFFLRPEIAARNADSINYAPTNERADVLIGAKLRDDARLHPPPALQSRLKLVPVLDPSQEAISHRYWHSIRQRFLALHLSAEDASSDNPNP